MWDLRLRMLTWCRLRTILQGRVTQQTRLYRTQSDEFPRITVPQKMVDNMEKWNLKKVKEQAKKHRFNLTTLLISAKNKDYEFYKGQKFEVFDPEKLASHRWKSRKCTEDYFTLVPHHGNPSIAKDDTAQRFKDLPLDKSIIKYLLDDNIKYATNIQSMVIPKMLEGRHVLCAAETGSGKTYAYLLPIVHNILQQKRNGILNRDETSAPHTLILVPTLELADQILLVCEKLAEKVPFVPKLIKKGPEMKEQLKRDGGMYMDVAISTPGTVNPLFTKKYLKTSKMSFLVLDEADTLLDGSFSGLVNKVLQTLMVGGTSPTGSVFLNEGVQMALVSATFPQGLDDTVGSVLPVNSFEQITTRHLHQLMPHIPQKFMKMKSIDRPARIVSILKKNPKLNYMIFVNQQNACCWLSKTLKEMGLPNACVNGFLNEETRSRELRSFLDGDCNILVCTDIASRGIDTTMVDHVINYDCPNHLSDYIHRAGRVGRVGSKNTGQVTSFVIHAWDVDLVWKIEIAARKQTVLHNVNANIKGQLVSRYEAKKGLKFDEDED